MDELNYKINKAPVAEEDKPRSADTSGETLSSAPPTNNKTEVTS